MRTMLHVWLIGLMLLGACQRQQAFFAEEKSPEGGVLRHQDPLLFAFDQWEDSVTLDIRLAITFNPEGARLENSNTVQDSAGMYAMVMGEDSRLVMDKKFYVSPKSAESVEWVRRLGLPKGRYMFKLYADNPAEENLKGILKVAVFIEKSGNSNSR